MTADETPKLRELYRAIATDAHAASVLKLAGS